MDQQYIHTLTLDERSILRRSAEIEQEREKAINDLLKRNHFAPEAMDAGPYHLHLSVKEARLSFAITPQQTQESKEILLSLSPLKRIVKDYFLICESHYQAITHGQSHKVEALDMGRRGIHDEGAERLQSLLEGKIAIDFPTARRLFTLICVLHIRQ